MARAIDQLPRTRNDLSARLAGVRGADGDARVLVEYYRDQLIPNQVRVYRAVYQRYQVAERGELNYNDVLAAQQNLGSSVAAYLTALGSLWTAVVELASAPSSTSCTCRRRGGRPLARWSGNPRPGGYFPPTTRAYRAGDPGTSSSSAHRASSAFVGPPRP